VGGRGDGRRHPNADRYPGGLGFVDFDDGRRRTETVNLSDAVTVISGNV
jgi:hypothetical protein